MVTIPHRPHLLSHKKKKTFFPSFPFFPLRVATFLVVLHSSQPSQRHTVAHRLVNAAALVSQGAYRSLSRSFRRHRIMARMVLAYGTWGSCRSAKWEARHRTGRTCESRVVIFDEARDIPKGYASKRRSQYHFAYNWTIHRTTQDFLACLTAACRN
jgi:hypothetical protein